ncbi:hypothetical protein EAF00_008655 [Botryotinia globosa]|nr:hypothetical protein EAF00_008655 [Botryotinia globosa]
MAQKQVLRTSTYDVYISWSSVFVQGVQAMFKTNPRSSSLSTWQRRLLCYWSSTDFIPDALSHWKNELRFVEVELYPTLQRCRLFVSRRAGLIKAILPVPVISIESDDAYTKESGYELTILSFVWSYGRAAFEEKVVFVLCSISITRVELEMLQVTSYNLPLTD